jgi:hypothetical protein
MWKNEPKLAHEWAHKYGSKPKKKARYKGKKR